MKRISTLIFLFCIAIVGCEGDYAIYNMHPPETIVIEVPVEVPVEVKVPVSPDGDVWIDSFDQPTLMDGVDVVWLIDGSGSMQMHAQSVIDGIEAMMLALPPAGWRLGIATTSWSQAEMATTFPLVPGDTVQDAWDYYSMLPNSGMEAGLDTLYSYIMDNVYNQSWLRSNAGLLVVFVSDEEDQSSRDFLPSQSGVQDFISWYSSLRPSTFLASIVNVHATENDCGGVLAPPQIGQRYIDVTNALGGVVVDICSSDWTPGVQAVTGQTEPYTEWELTYQPIEDTLIVFANSVEMSGLDWFYNSATNSVEFIVIPAEGSHIEIGYIIDREIGDDDDSSGA